MTFCSQAFWTFSLGHYGLEPVCHACMQLQDQYQGNINLALLLAWLDRQGYGVDTDGIEELTTALKPTQELLTRYRAMRRDLKPRLSKSDHQQILNFELELEKQQQQDLIQALNRLSLASFPTATPSGLALYCLQLNASHLIAAINPTQDLDL